jgi:hypothetical protein
MESKARKKGGEDMINKGRKSCVPYPVCFLYRGRKCQLDTAPLSQGLLTYRKTNNKDALST